MTYYPDDIEYSNKYDDDFYEYRHVVLNKQSFKIIKNSGNKILSVNK